MVPGRWAPPRPPAHHRGAATGPAWAARRRRSPPGPDRAERGAAHDVMTVLPVPPDDAGASCGGNNNEATEGRRVPNPDGAAGNSRGRHSDAPPGHRTDPGVPPE